MHQASLGVNRELGDQLARTRLPTQADRRRAFLGHLSRELPANPLAPPAARRRHPKMLPEGARDKLLGAASTARDRLVITWLSDGGFRVGELCGLHFADLHVGMENYGQLDPQTGISSRIRDFLDRLDEIVDFAIDHDADLVVFAGDAFKTRDPDPTQQREFARRIKKLADRIPVFMLVGNHDIPGIAARATSIDIFRTLEVGNIMVGRTIGSQVVQTRRGPVFLGWVPFPVRGRLISQEDQRGASVEDLDRAVAALLSGEMADLARQAAQESMPRESRTRREMTACVRRSSSGASSRKL
jgi:exonuclease SbcD